MKPSCVKIAAEVGKEVTDVKFSDSGKENKPF